MDLPLVEEIREARRLADEAQSAAIFQQRIHNALTAVAVVQRQLASLPSEAGVAIPADELIDALAEQWRQLSDLPAAGPRAMHSVAERLRMRRMQLEAADQLISPIARESEARSHHLAHLQQAQQQALADPKFASAVAELQRVGVERERTRVQLEPLKMKMQAIDPSTRVVRSFVEHLDQVIASDMPIPGAAAWRAGVVARDLAAAVDGLLHELHFEVSHPVPPTIPDAPSVEDADATMAAAIQTRDALTELLAALEGEHAQLSVAMTSLQERYDGLTQQIVDRLG